VGISLIAASGLAAPSCMTEYTIMVDDGEGNNMCLDVENNSKRSGANIIWFYCYGYENQQWLINHNDIKRKVPTQIISKSSDKCVTKGSATRDNGEYPVVQEECRKDNPDQLLLIVHGERFRDGQSPLTAAIGLAIDGRLRGKSCMRTRNGARSARGNVLVTLQQCDYETHLLVLKPVEGQDMEDDPVCLNWTSTTDQTRSGVVCEGDTFNGEVLNSEVSWSDPYLYDPRCEDEDANRKIMLVMENREGCKARLPIFDTKEFFRDGAVAISLGSVYSEQFKRNKGYFTPTPPDGSHQPSDQDYRRQCNRFSGNLVSGHLERL